MHELVKVTAEDDWRAYHAIRRRVLWEARGRNDYNDKHPDEYLPDNHPLLLKYEGQPVGTTRLDVQDAICAFIRRVAIAEEMQHKGHGRVLSHSVEDYAWVLGVRTLFVSAAPDATGFYEKMGWEVFIWDQAALMSSANNIQMRKLLA